MRILNKINKSVLVNNEMSEYYAMCLKNRDINVGPYGLSDNSHD